MKEFIHHYQENVIGHLSGFDRLVIRGTLRSLAVTSGMMDFLNRMSVRLKDFGAFAERKTAELKQASLALARDLERPIQYLPSPRASKEEIARRIADEDNITQGLICVLTSVEPCHSYEIYRDRDKKIITLEPRWRKCLFLYHYWIDPIFGFMNARIQTWFPFSVQVCLNGREWLARQMDRCAMHYNRIENCFVWIEDTARAQHLMDRQLNTDWPAVLDRIARQLNPAHEQMLAPYRVEYYWSTYQSEWATDILFDSPAALGSIYPALVRSGICAFGSKDVMRFLGKKPNGNFQGQIVSDYLKRPEGIRLKHRLKANSIKLYDKQGSVLRVETTINDAKDFWVYRPKEGQPNGPLEWRRMRKGVADLYRRTQLSQECNERYLQALASIHVARPVSEVMQSICSPIRWKGKPVRALRPWSCEDFSLLQTINRAEFALQGFRNRDLLEHLYRGNHSRCTRKRLSSRMTHRLRILRAHGMIRKIPHTHRYRLTQKGQQVATAMIHIQHIPISKLTEMAA